MTFSLNPASTTKSSGNSYSVNVGGITTLSSVIDASGTTIQLTSSVDFPTSGTVLIGSEYITYSGKSSNDLTGCVRGVALSSNVNIYETILLIYIYSLYLYYFNVISQYI